MRIWAVEVGATLAPRGRNLPAPSCRIAWAAWGRAPNRTLGGLVPPGEALLVTPGTSCHDPGEGLPSCGPGTALSLEASGPPFGYFSTISRSIGGARNCAQGGSEGPGGIRRAHRGPLHGLCWGMESPVGSPVGPGRGVLVPDPDPRGDGKHDGPGPEAPQVSLHT